MRQFLARAKLVVSCLIILFAMLSGSVAALSTAQLNLYQDGINFFEQDATSCSTIIASVSLLGSDTPTKIWNYFAQKGLSAAGTAGILGNINAESNFNPAAEQTHGAWEDMSTLNINQGGKGGVGLVQWDGGRRPAVINYLMSQGLTDADFHQASDALLGAELNYIWKELNGPYLSTLQTLQKETDPGQAAYDFNHTYEGSDDSAAAIQNNRVAPAIAYYAKYGGSSVSASGISDYSPDGSGCSSTDAYTSANFPLYSQCDPKWGSHPYWGDNICGSGCGPTSMAMIITALTGQAVTPDMIADFYTSKGLEGSWAGAAVAAQKWGLQSKPLGLDVAKITAAIQSGSYVIVAGKGGLPFTSAGHFVVIRGVTSNGQWILGDPDTATGHSNTEPWDPSTVIAGIVNDGAASSVVAISK